MTLNFNDFQKQDIKFDIVKLQESYKEIIKTRKFEVGENFPRLVPGLIPEGISNVTYNINLHAINDFIFESSYWGDS